MNKKVKISLDDDLAELFDEAKDVMGNSEKNEHLSTAKNNDVIEFEIKSTDDELVSALKNLINISKLTMQEIYDIKTQRNGYNMVYSLRKEKSQLGIERIKAWCDILHKKPVLTFIDMTDEEIKEVDEKLKQERKNMTKKKK
jgi:hypothetical protein